MNGFVASGSMPRRSSQPRSSRPLSSWPGAPDSLAPRVNISTQGVRAVLEAAG
jgi:uncharacterized protein with von Willebrand factor type A (vWA) domain